MFMIGIYTLLISTANVQSDDILGFALQPDGTMTNTSYIKYKGDIPTMTAFCACFQAFQVRGRDPTMLLNYATANSNSEIIFLWRYILEEIVFICCQGKVLRYFKNVYYRRLEWHSFCVCANLTDNVLRLTVNGNTQFLYINNGTNSSLTYHVNGGGDLYIGQYILNIDGTRTKDFSYSGIIANFTLTNEFESVQAAENYTTCGTSNFNGDIVMRMNDTDRFEIGNNTQSMSLSHTSICVPQKYIISYFTTQREPHEADQVCLALGGRLAVPSKSDENNLIYNEAKKFESICGTLSWLGYQFSSEHHMPYDRRSNELQSYNEFLAALRLPRQENCVTIDLKRAVNESWNVENCRREECFTCSFTTRPVFTLRGLCLDTKFDTRYTLYGYTNYKPSFIGRSNSRIIWSQIPGTNDTKERWVIQYGSGTETYGYILDDNIFSFPVGLNEWLFVKDICPGGVKAQKILFTKCSQNMYACNNGECIKKESRCNQRMDCSDGSDELRCRILNIPAGYDSRMAPPKTLQANVTEVHQYISINAIHLLDINKQTITVEFTSKLYWFDSRLEFRNLKESYTSNFLSKDIDIWKPKQKFFGSDNTVAISEIVTRNVWAEKWTTPLEDSLINIDTDKRFNGKENPLFMSTTYKNTYVCNVNLEFYPFDVQTCAITDINAHEPNIVSMFTQEVNFEGKMFLPEYELINITSESITMDIFNGNSIIFKFRNLYRYYIFSTYIPTSLMSFVCYWTFWFDLKDFTNRIMVSLTALLVLTSLFSQIGILIPKTSYVKLIDIWFLGCISANFAMISLQVVITVIGNRVERFPKRKPMRISSEYLDRKCKYGFPIIFILATFAYFIQVFSIHY